MRAIMSVANQHCSNPSECHKQASTLTPGRFVQPAAVRWHAVELNLPAAATAQASLTKAHYNRTDCACRKR
jgi:hypothetical protein